MDESYAVADKLPMVEIPSSSVAEAGLHNATKIHPPDRGIHAWLFLCGCFSIESLVWGFPFSYGVFEQYYSTHEPFSSSLSGIAIIGTLTTGVMYFLAPFVMGFLKRFPQHRRPSTFIGLTILMLSLIASSFATAVWQLILTQGIFYAIGGCMLYLPTIMYLDEWFVTRKGLALGVTFAGTGVGGMVIPLGMGWALNRYHVSTALRIWAIILVVLTTPLLYFIKPRLPVPSDHKTLRNEKVDLGFLREPVFWFMQAGNTIQGIGYFIPTVFLPTYASILGLSSTLSSLTLSVLNASSVIGQVTLGALSDRYPVTHILGISSIGSSVAVFLIWGLSTSTAPLYVFSIVYGLFAGGYSSCWSAMILEIQKKDPKAETGLVLGLLAAGRGVGCVVCGPLSNSLLKDRVWYHEVGGAYGTGYGLLIVFTGISAMLGGASFLGRSLKAF